MTAITGQLLLLPAPDPVPFAPALRLVKPDAPAPASPSVPDPLRHLCDYCDQPVLIATINADTLGRGNQRGHHHELRIIADIHEWEPRAQCGSCLHTRRAHPHLPEISCARCADTGYTGTRRPPGWMLAVDMAWGDDIHLRVIGPRTDRREGEALYPMHICTWR